jgi:arylsulfatase A-like enzyme
MRAILSVAVLALLAPSARAADPKQPPNILLIYTDDQSTRTIDCYPDAWPFARTPQIGRLASGGVQFRGAYLGAWCMPSRASILTGRFPHGIESMRMAGKYPGSEYDPKLCPFWPALFRASGYHTAQIGKWHTGTDAGFGRDWDYQIVWNRP